MQAPSCPECGGANYRLLAPGFRECTSTVERESFTEEPDLNVVPAPNAYGRRLVRNVSSETCGHRYQVGSPDSGSAGWPIGRAGADYSRSESVRVAVPLCVAGTTLSAPTPLSASGALPILISCRSKRLVLPRCNPTSSVATRTWLTSASSTSRCAPNP